MMRPRSLHAAGFLFMAIAMVLLAGCGGPEKVDEQEAARPVKTVIVAGGDAIPRQLPGLVQAANQVDLSFRVGGPLVSLTAREGDEVKRGTVLARIDPRDYEIRLDATQAQLVKAEADFTRMSALYEKEAVSVAQLDQARATRDLARSDVDKAEADLNDTDLRAPMNSTIGKTFVKNFQEVRPKQPVLSLVDLSGLEIVVGIPEIAMARFDIGKKEIGALFARFDSDPDREFPLTVKEVAAQADPATQTYAITLAMPQPEGLNVRPGMTATVVYKPDSADSAVDVVIPAVAVFTDTAGSSMVWVVDPETLTVSSRQVTTGSLVGTDQIQVASGLVAGDRIAVSAVTRLREGMQIHLME